MKNLLLLICFLITASVFAQKKNPENWQTLDPKKDKVYGVGSEEAYKTLATSTSKKMIKTTIVAVIDSGVDPNHEDLKDVIWLNEGEIPDNGIDDDKNGYIDDVNGWSFLGGKNGDINYEATELARIVQKGKKKYQNLTDESKLSGDELKEYQEYKKLNEKFTNELINQEKQLESIKAVEAYLQKVKTQNNGVLNKEAFKNYKPEGEMETQLNKAIIPAISLGLVKPEEIEAQVKDGIDHFEPMVKYSKLDSDSLRTFMVGDDVNNSSEKYYGNNHVQGPDARHGTHVAGIIAASRGNKLGIEGIANNVKIMILRAVPNGDERDKDVANAIYYAVDNGATVINMSFGKYYSPDKKLVDAAVKYAQSKDVLLIHAAGNESKDNDVELSFPNREFLEGGIASNWIQVGASAYKKGETIIGSFSNYGQTKVDLFAPGVDVYATVPGSKYESLSGTSMASPSTAGVAAILRSYFPELKAEEVKAVMMKTVVPYSGKVNVPGLKKPKGLRKKMKPVKRKVSELCISGGFVNVNNAVIELMKKK